MTNRWGNSGNSDRLDFGGLWNHCRWWVQPWNWNTLTPWEKSYDQPRQHFKKQRHYFVNKFCLVKAMVFPVVMYGCESWTIKKAEHRNIDAFELWCWRRLLRVPWTARRSNQSILKDWIFSGRTDAEAETPIFWQPDVKNWLFEKTLMLGKIEGRRRRGWDEDGITESMDMSLSKLRKFRMDRKVWRAALDRVSKSWTWLSDWNELNRTELNPCHITGRTKTKQTKLMPS